MTATPQEKESKWILDYLQPKSDFPKQGVTFQWYGPLLRDPKALHRITQELAQRYREMHIDVIAGLDARGFIFGATLAYELRVPFVLVRKEGKLPGDIVSTSYTMEYGTKTVEMESESIQSNQKVLVVDDVLATGGTTLAACTLIEKLGGQVAEVCCLMEIAGLPGREALTNYPVFTLVRVE